MVLIFKYITYTCIVTLTHSAVIRLLIYLYVHVDVAYLSHLGAVFLFIKVVVVLCPFYIQYD